MEEVLEKVEAARKWVDSHGFSTDIEIDGGVDEVTARRAWDAGANVFVAGSAIFKAADPAAAAAGIREVIEGARFG
jgi:ribulose-phosphate 3-epimerase